MIRYLLTIWFTTVTLFGPGIYYCGKGVAAPGLPKAKPSRGCHLVASCTAQARPCVPCPMPFSTPCRTDCCQRVYPFADMGVEKGPLGPAPHDTPWPAELAPILLVTQPAIQSLPGNCFGPILCFSTGADFVRACHYLLC